MKFTLSWLKEFIDTNASLDEISAKLTAVGLEVEGIEDPSEKLKGFVVGHVLECEKHPDADKLKCLIVDNGREKLKVVCGAPNARAGMKGIFAPSGSVMPVSGITLKKSLIRGQESNGMMCGLDELIKVDESAGIVEIDDKIATGSDAAEALGLDDPVIEINLTPNRGDCAGILGIARDLAAAGVGKLKPLPTAPAKSAFKNPVSVTIQDTQACPLFIGRYIRGVKNGPAQPWLKERLTAVGLRPISTLVDITNYLTVALGRPSHVFDAAKLKGNIHVRLSKKGEALAALNDKTYTLEEGMTVVCDDSGVLGLGGIIGGTSTAVDENTKDIYLEIAYFDPTRTAKTGQALQIDSDARYRFERGIDPAFAMTGLEIATNMIIDLCGGEASEPFVAGAVPDITKTIVYKPERLKTLGGSDLPETRQKDILAALGFTVANDWKVKTPSWRHDLEGAADIVEEILRIDGYDNIPAQPVVKAPGDRLQALSPLQKRAATTRRVLAARGLSETVTWSFMEDHKADLFGANDTQQKRALTLLNPISADLAVMRPSVLPNLIDAAGRNTDKGIPDAALFEIGNIYKSPEAEGQIMVATGLRFGNAAPRHWSGPARAVDAIDAKADAFAVLETCGLNPASVQITTDAPEWYHPGRSGTLRQGAAILGYFGEMHPAVMLKLKREEATVGFEILLQNIPASRKKGPRKELLKPSPFQPVFRDFAFIVDEKLETEKLVRAIRGAERALITAVDIFDVYTGKGIEPGKKSIALGVTIQPVEKTLTDTEINALSQKIVEAVQKQAGGVLRT
jgi:phenylalanyl-tRNA synthetase beta chain